MRATGARLARLHKPNGPTVAILPRVCEGIGCAQLVARGEQKQRRTHAVGDMKSAQRLYHRLHPVLVGRHGEHAEGTGLRALLFESLDVHFKL